MTTDVGNVTKWSQSVVCGMARHFASQSHVEGLNACALRGRRFSSAVGPRQHIVVSVCCTKTLWWSLGSAL